MRSVKATVILYDSLRGIIGTAFTYAEPDVVKPGETATYDISKSKGDLSSSDVADVKINYQGQIF